MSGFSRIREKKYIANITIVEAFLSVFLDFNYLKRNHCRLVQIMHYTARSLQEALLYAQIKELAQILNGAKNLVLKLKKKLVCN